MTMKINLLNFTLPKLEKFFEDALQECGVIPDDSPKYVIESGRKRYHWVSTETERKLVFNIEVVQ